MSLNTVDSAIELSDEYNVPIIIMHMQGCPKTMQLEPKYDNIIDDIFIKSILI